jgi:hypothetical protein
VSNDDNLMLDALDVLCTSRQQTEPPTLPDLFLIRTCLEVRLKGAPAEARIGVVHRMKKFLLRCRASTFASAQLRRDLARLHALQAQQPGRINRPAAGGDMNRPAAGGGGRLPRACAGSDRRALRHPERMAEEKGAARLALAAERKEIAAHVAEFLRW